MSGLFNPYAFTPTGERTSLAAPPVLRVHGDAGVSKQQMVMAQHAFATFCGRSRVSFWQNPNEQGRLPDGTPYRITVVGNTTVMQIWPVAGDEKDTAQGGVSFIAVFGDAVARQYVISFGRNGWKLRAAPIVYGGTGVWASSGRKQYFTDSLVRAGSMPYELSRRFNPDNGDMLVVNEGVTSIEGGLAYGASSGASMVGFVSPAGKFVQVLWDREIAASIYESELLDPKIFLETPDVAEAAPSFKQRVEAAPPGLSLAASQLYGLAAFSRLRSGEAVYFPLYSVVAVYEVDGGTYTEGWLFPVTHELQVTASGSGGYSAAVVEHAAPELLLLEPPKALDPGSGLMLEQTHFKFNKHGWTESGQEPVTAVGYVENGDTGDRYPAETVLGWENVKARATTTERATKIKKHRMPYYLGRNWGDEKVAFFVRIEREKDATVRCDVNEDFSQGLIYHVTGPGLNQWLVDGTVNNHRISLLDPDDVIPSFGSGGDPNTTFRAGVRFDSDPAPGMAGYTDHGQRFVADRTTDLRTKATLETPWGEIIINDVDLEVRTKLTYASGWYLPEGADQFEYRYVGITGRQVQRVISHVNPILGVVGYVEITTSAYTVNQTSKGTSASTTGTTAQVVLLCRGQEIFREDVEPTEGSSLRATASTTSEICSFNPFTENGGGSSLLRGRTGGIWDLPSSVWVPASVGLILPSGVGDFATEADRFVDTAMDYYPTATVGDSRSHWFRSAIDPGSGGGVVMATAGAEQTTKTFAISPGGVVQLLDELLPDTHGPLQSYYSHLISV